VYVPNHFRAQSEDELYAVIDRYMFATVISAVDGASPRATMVPFVAREDGGRRRLWGHMARANPHWRDFQPVREILVVFRGPHTYISPSWYADEPNVPTWNFVVVHVYGRPRLLEPDDPRVLWVLEQTVEQAEARTARPWQLAQAGDYARQLAPGVAAFEIEVARVEGSLKLSQNHPRENRRGVIAALAASESSDAREIADLMRARDAAS